MSREFVDIITTEPGGWSSSDAWSLYCFFTHAFAKAGKYSYYMQALSEIAWAKVSDEVIRIAKDALEEIPFLAPEEWQGAERLGVWSDRK